VIRNLLYIGFPAALPQGIEVSLGNFLNLIVFLLGSDGENTIGKLRLHNLFE
jgi:hypothetical protein